MKSKHSLPPTAVYDVNPMIPRCHWVQLFSQCPGDPSEFHTEADPPVPREDRLRFFYPSKTARSFCSARFSILET